MQLTEHDITRKLQEHLKEFIMNALTNLYLQDYAIIKNPTGTHIYEPSLTARIAMHLHEQLKHNEYNIDFELATNAGYRVDCEYNKDGSLEKLDQNNSERRPDILLHKRAIHTFGSGYRTSAENILFCEVKWGALSKDDKKKLEYMADKYQYYCSLGIDHITGDGIKLVFRFVNNDDQVQTEEYKWDAENQKLVKR